MTSSEMDGVIYILTGRVIFSSFFDNIEGYDDYYISEMPGEIEGIHGSCLTGLNIGVAKFISNEKIEASIEVVKYFTSPEIQKKFIIKLFKCFTALKSLYDDEEVCSILNCDLAKNIQSIPRPGNLVDNYDSYSVKVVNLIYEFLFSTKPINKILIDIDNLTRIHTFTIKEFPDVIFFGILICLFSIVSISPLMLLIPKFKDYFQFLSTDGWILYTIGFLLIIANEILNFGELTLIKCDLNLLFFSLSFSFIYTPIIQKLISNIPMVNKYSYWVSSNKIIFYGIVILVEVVYNLLYLIQPFKLKKQITEDEHNHIVCLLKNKFSIIIALIQLFMNFSFYLIIVILIFMEWHIAKTKQSIRNLTFTMATSAPSFVLLIALKYINIKNFKIIYMIRMCITVIFILTNHMYVFFFRLILFKFHDNGRSTKKMLNKYFKAAQSDGFDLLESSLLSKHSETSSIEVSPLSKAQKIISHSNNKLLICHYSTEQIE